MDKAALRTLRAKQFGYAFFIILAFANLLGDLLDGNFRIVDFTLVAITVIPFLINKNWITLSFGVICAFISTFIFLGIFASHTNAASENTLDPIWNYMIGYFFSIISLIASIFLIYVGFYDKNQGELEIAQNAQLI